MWFKVKVDPFWSCTTRVMFFLLIITVLTIALILIVKMCIRFCQQFYRIKASNTENQVEFISPFKKDKSTDNRNTKNSRHMIFSLFGRSNNEKIRKHFLKAVLENADEKLALNYLTPLELSGFALAKEGRASKKTGMTEDEIRIVDLYEKARYSGKECSGEDVQSVKDMIKQARLASKKG